ncbi:hypothetical protein FAZ19_11900 [Sphingobacterium alkalisoli]|uniref:Uncharacterized protein n=1 Tax=Sphingobacterium alkalisoli TaxID=1874115 RepID=A0A4U0H2H4_9SPHI|nr:hypothetical protein [Sphingobacterium alkalisoli]TJY65815.1 hypothetical protein FAZ19_11900 [Sphingobacterium alkalisoli]GGH18153.1 hypothetical protein GCM10011418_21600 [Sphingobacterium alkalisoli]
MDHSEFDEIASIIELLEFLRNHFRLEKNEVDRLAELKAGQYSRMVGKNQKIDLESLRDVCKKIYNLTVKELLNLDGKIPKEDNLPKEIRELTAGRNTVRSQERLDLTSYLIIIIAKHYKTRDIVSNKVIRLYLPPNLINKSIELGKTNIKHCFEDINKGAEIKRKVYKLISPISAELIKKARESVDPTWLKEFEEKVRDSDGKKA